MLERYIELKILNPCVLQNNSKSQDRICTYCPSYKKFVEWGQKLNLKDYARQHKGLFSAVPIGKLPFKGVELESSIGGQMPLLPLLNETIVLILSQLHGCT